MPRSYGGHVYIMASGRNGTLYIGVTSDLMRRVWEHREGLVRGFTRDHAVTRLVYTEAFERIEDAIAREKAMKKWQRLWKLDLIESVNPEWDDLYEAV